MRCIALSLAHGQQHQLPASSFCGPSLALSVTAQQTLNSECVVQAGGILPLVSSFAVVRTAFQSQAAKLVQRCWRRRVHQKARVRQIVPQFSVAAMLSSAPAGLERLKSRAVDLLHDN